MNEKVVDLNAFRNARNGGGHESRVTNGIKEEEEIPAKEEISGEREISGEKSLHDRCWSLLTQNERLHLAEQNISVFNLCSGDRRGDRINAMKGSKRVVFAMSEDAVVEAFKKRDWKTDPFLASALYERIMHSLQCD